MKFRETPARSAIKSLAYRVMNVAVDFIVIWLLTRHLFVTISLTVITNVTSTLLYYGNERVWNRVSWGKRR